MVHRLGLIGYGVIAKGQHLPVIAQNPDFILTAIASRHQPQAIEGVRIMPSAEALLAADDIDAITLCTPPGIHFIHASEALAAGKHVLLEKPPTATLGEARALLAQATRMDRVLFASWHSQFNASIAAARTILERSPPKGVQVVWQENVEVFHPGQQWIWQPGGFGVFDTGINALSILSRLLPDPLIVTGGTMVMGPGGATPIAAHVKATTGKGNVDLNFDWRVTEARRIITILTEDGQHLSMPANGRHLWVDGVEVFTEEKNEYPRLYQHFATLLKEGRSDVDLEPLRIVADSFLMCRREPQAA